MDAVKEHFTNIPPNAILIVGDRLFTDVLMANKGKMQSLWLRKTISESGDPRLAIWIRCCESKFFDCFHKH